MNKASTTAVYPIPDGALAHHIAILGKTGSGKSNAAKTLAERALDRGERVCVLDPTGTWYGMRLTRAGKASRYKMVIFGGQHADIQIARAHGAAIAEIVGTSSTPAIIDTRLMTVGDRTQFFTDFAETLIRKNKGPLTLIVDEAHLFAPQTRVNDPKSSAMVHAANNLVSLGRGLGLRIVLISQRPAKLHKDSLTQVETLVAMRLIYPLDREAVREWIKEAADLELGKEIIASLPSMPTGDSWVWSPEIDVLRRSKFPLAGTFDSGSPVDGAAGPDLAPLDLNEVTARLQKAAADVLANDPRTLKAEVARLSREVEQAKIGAEPDYPDQRQEVRQLSDELSDLRGYISLLEGRFDRIAKEIELPVARKSSPPSEIQSSPPRKPVIEHHPRPVTRHIPVATLSRHPTPAPASGNADGVVPSGCAKPLAALASGYPYGMSEAQWATIAGYKRKGGTWGEYRRRLSRAGMIEQSGGQWFATELGASAAGDVELPPSPGPELARWWAKRISGTPKMVEVLIDAWPNAIGREEIGERMGMIHTGGSFGEYVRRLKRNEIAIEDAAGIRLSAEVMGNG